MQPLQHAVAKERSNNKVTPASAALIIAFQWIVFGDFAKSNLATEACALQSSGRAELKTDHLAPSFLSLCLNHKF